MRARTEYYNEMAQEKAQRQPHLKPRYCRECGQRIERERWRSWHSAGFCDRCAPTLHLSWLGRTLAVATVGLIIGFGLGSWSAVRQNVPAPLLNLEPQRGLALLDVGLSTLQQEKESSKSKPSGDSTPSSQGSDSAPDQSPTKTTKRSEAKAVPATLCGAPTKSGKPCRRRVKGGGRCFQHRQIAPSAP